jgi:hypothetical protein
VRWFLTATMTATRTNKMCFSMAWQMPETRCPRTPNAQREVQLNGLRSATSGRGRFGQGTLAGAPIGLRGQQEGLPDPPASVRTPAPDQTSRSARRDRAHARTQPRSKQHRGRPARLPQTASRSRHPPRDTRASEPSRPLEDPAAQHSIDLQLYGRVRTFYTSLKAPRYAGRRRPTGPRAGRAASSGRPVPNRTATQPARTSMKPDEESHQQTSSSPLRESRYFEENGRDS